MSQECSLNSFQLYGRKLRTRKVCRIWYYLYIRSTDQAGGEGKM